MTAQNRGWFTVRYWQSCNDVWWPSCPRLNPSHAGISRWSTAFIPHTVQPEKTEVFHLFCQINLDISQLRSNILSVCFQIQIRCFILYFFISKYFSMYLLSNVKHRNAFFSSCVLTWTLALYLNICCICHWNINHHAHLLCHESVADISTI